MTTMRDRPVITIPRESHAQAVASLRRYAAEHLDEEMGDLKADLLLRHVLEDIGPTIYNQAIADARAFFEERTADLAAVCYRVEFPISTKRR
jgi:uncharacterized protein (DUF2164 family)